MRWFKHITQSFDDPRMQAYMDESKIALEAYGFFWRILEIVASQMTKDSQNPDVSYTLKRWSELCGIHHNKASRLLLLMHKHGLVTLVDLDSDSGGSADGGSGVTLRGSVRVSIPKLLKYRDEYQRKVRSKSQSQNIESDYMTSDVSRGRDGNDSNVVSINSPKPDDDPTIDTDDLDKNNSEIKSEKTEQVQYVSMDFILGLWRKWLPNNPVDPKVTQTRLQRIRQITEEHLHDESGWAWFIKYIATKNPFLIGKTKPKNGKPPFIASLDWCLKHALAIGDGRYEEERAYA